MRGSASRGGDGPRRVWKKKSHDGALEARRGFWKLSSGRRVSLDTKRRFNAFIGGVDRAMFYRRSGFKADLPSPKFDTSAKMKTNRVFLSIRPQETLTRPLARFSAPPRGSSPCAAPRALSRHASADPERSLGVLRARAGGAPFRPRAPRARPHGARVAFVLSNTLGTHGGTPRVRSRTSSRHVDVRPARRHPVLARGRARPRRVRAPPRRDGCIRSRPLSPMPHVSA